jgi:hypothetical protein
MREAKSRTYHSPEFKAKYRLLGIGMANQIDLDKRKFLVNDVVAYLTKTDQLLRIVRLGKDRCFGKDQSPEHFNVGRPRDDEK